MGRTYVEAGFKDGDVLRFELGGETFDARLASVRRVDWDSMRPNFYVLLSPGALENFPATYLTSFRLGKERKMFLNRLLRTYPTVTVIEIDAVLVGQVEQLPAERVEGTAGQVPAEVVHDHEGDVLAAAPGVSAEGARRRGTRQGSL